MEHIDRYLLEFLKDTAGVSDEIMGWVYPLTAAFAIGLLSYISFFFCKFANVNDR